MIYKTINYPNKIKELQENIKSLKEDKNVLKTNNKTNADGFSAMIIKGKEYMEKEQAGKAILELCRSKKNPELEEVGEYRGFKLELEFDSYKGEFALTMKNKYSYKIMLGDDIYGNITRINNAFDGIENRILRAKSELEDTEKQLENAKIEVQKPFAQEEILKEKEKRLKELNVLLKIGEKDKQVLDSTPDEEKENEVLEKEYNR